jgi:diketogulonate reductase-like aldo/keto reductase
VHTIELNTGARMPALGLGTWRLSGEGCEQAVAWALDAGYRHLDTAAMYGNEEAVGAGMRSSGVAREEVFVTTKLAGRDHGDPAKAAAVSAERLGLDYIDCYLIHWPAGQGADVEVWRALEGLHRDGTLRAIGVSNYSAAQVQELMDVAEVPPAVNQIELNPFTRQREVERFCHDRGVALQAYQPLGRASRFGDSLVTSMTQKYDRTPAQVMLRWGLQQGVAVIPKSGHRDRIHENADIFDFELADDDMAALDAAG